MRKTTKVKNQAELSARKRSGKANRYYMYVSNRDLCRKSSSDNLEIEVKEGDIKNG